MKIKTRDITKIALLVALIAVGAFISIPIGPVPFTLQNFFVFMTGLLLTPFYAGLTVFIYVLLGLIGIPIFAGFTGGYQSFLKPSFGFLIAFIIGAAFISKFAHGEKNFGKIMVVLVLAEVIFYAIGLPYMYVILNYVMGNSMDVAKVFSIGMIPFIIPDMAKAVVAAIIAPRILKALNN
ncbi:biotin transporter BioY [Peptoniphilus gorbachii]|uniref:Biotin transporter n=1 Tax=Peptoniphilus gorbachii TaxID=411567 RepID=A0A6N3DP90_9FIRM|nr:biotin transporter BioY [Peptoniphilus harei]MBS5945982.1 biotin transporter BioY [Peptoniphilus harei]MDU3010984.1 biotin transporter BioY [Peptoniphilus harei]MDU4046754.1 biotin transporter BioY [Peptoniphilus harei]